ncbi:cupin domain-containing protein [Acinetobacter baumannii]|uniref:cupin domain-containing protein n=1 Tax=Acinetobacter baumannii TaxID=470 RepID=UPI0023400A06|nr:cupin domain-containing protein [Acinetobacter baumannii]MDC4887081.1 cupin domain-containing protein [Acinetobacter baumannii]MDC4927172.1 cupin domain-containing protein [Acinetobacter baumannii]MDC4941435.1 cupin domain-containing protein [Acinetobacter baumannii]MDK2107216.1 cupin domain-containing protein [Acinetobacter baumannii]MDK2112551.1 cupin domain-containing protein [Acinetobacter baumannii]
MDLRRVVTGNDESGHSIFISDSIPYSYTYEHVPGFKTCLIWTHNRNNGSNHTETVSATSSLAPLKGETKLLIVDFPPDSIYADGNFDPKAAFNEQKEHLLGLFDHFEADNPGMHKTHTVDFGIILEGEISLELDNNEVKILKKGDYVIQQEARHAWRNHSATFARLAFILIGN